mgnify:CR=1 FL=1
MWYMKNHGLGIYQGIEKIEVDKITKDYMKNFLCGRKQPVYSCNAAGSDPEVCRSRCKKAKAEQAGK